MRFTLAAVLGFAAIVTAQSASSGNSTASSAAPATTSMSAESKCLATCSATDICCKAKCVNVPCPSGAQANATTECAARCPQGNGTQADTDKYAACEQSCISSYYLSTGTFATATGSASRTSDGATATGIVATGSSSASASGSSATHNAAPEVRFDAAGLGLIGLIAAGLAL